MKSLEVKVDKRLQNAADDSGSDCIVVSLRGHFRSQIAKLSVLFPRELR
jgi:hypothetical protein